MAFPTKYNGGKFDARSNEYRMVSVEITSQERTPPGVVGG
jgi:hypothetical protein